jgi:hypothetical protein
LYLPEVVSQTNIDTLPFIDNSCFDYWQEYKVYPSDDIWCFIEINFKIKIDSSSFIVGRSLSDTTYVVIEIKKMGNILFFKNQYSEDKYKLFFNFNTLQGGKIKRSEDPRFSSFKIVLRKKIKIRGEYLYKLQYKPIGFFSSVTDYMYFNKNGELVMIYLGYWGRCCLREDYFGSALTEEELKKL